MQDNILPLIGRTAPLFEKDIAVNEAYLSETIRNSRFLGKRQINHFYNCFIYATFIIAKSIKKRIWLSFY